MTHNPIDGQSIGFLLYQGTMEISRSILTMTPDEISSQLDRLRDENEKLKQENVEMWRHIHSNSGKIKRDRKSLKYAEIAFYLLLGVVVALVLGYQRESDGAWRYEFPIEVIGIVCGAGGIAWKLFERDDDGDQSN